jgi:hypothetical protein
MMDKMHERFRQNRTLYCTGELKSERLGVRAFNSRKGDYHTISEKAHAVHMALSLVRQFGGERSADELKESPIGEWKF